MEQTFFKARPKTNNQKRYYFHLETGGFPLVIGTGYAGTGKTLLATNIASHKLNDNKIKKIVLIRPPEPLAKRTVGFLKGSAQDKMTPWIAQMTKYIKDAIGSDKYNEYIEEGKIEIQLLETIRGTSFNDAYIIVDEAQLLSKKEMQCLTTRIGENSKLILCGDTLQCESNTNDNGLQYVIDIIDKYNINGQITEFSIDDCQRSDLCKQFLYAYDTEGWL